MERNDVIAKLRAHQAELRAAGVASVSIIGSAARGDDTEASDIDVVVRLADEAAATGLAYFGRLAAIERRLEAILGRPVDVVAEPVARERVRERIEKERVLAF
jgi:predicted nucleotidyltransferase